MARTLLKRGDKPNASEYYEEGPHKPRRQSGLGPLGLIKLGEDDAALDEYVRQHHCSETGLLPLSRTS
jgi:hypothetical protein